MTICMTVECTTKMTSLATPIYRRPNVAPGCILLNERWRGSSLTKQLTDAGKGQYCDDLGVVDFCPSESVSILYIPEEELLCEVYEYKLRKMLELQLRRPMIITIRNVVTDEKFSKLQDTCLEHSVVLYPIGNHSELSRFLLQMAYIESKSPSNPFKKRRSASSNATPPQLKLFAVIPGIGEKKAQLLMNHFRCPQQLTSIPEEKLIGKLAPIVGDSAAQKVYKFIYDRIRVCNNKF